MTTSHTINPSKKSVDDIIREMKEDGTIVEPLESARMTKEERTKAERVVANIKGTLSDLILEERESGI